VGLAAEFRFNAQEVLDLMLFASMYKPRSVNAGGSFTLPPFDEVEIFDFNPRITPLLPVKTAYI
jgi:hypothetical protein